MHHQTDRKIQIPPPLLRQLVSTGWKQSNDSTLPLSYATYPLRSVIYDISAIYYYVKAGICARDRRALQQLALNVHVKHTELT